MKVLRRFFESNELRFEAYDGDAMIRKTAARLG